MKELTFYPLSEVEDDLIKYAVIAARYGNQWILCRHKDRDTWELPGGHREPGETTLEAARRELYEETGVTDADLHIVGAYSLSKYGLLCFADVKKLGQIPDCSEMAEAKLFEVLPKDLTYGAIHGQLHEWVQNWQNMQNSAGELWDVYDENRNLTGKLHRRGEYLPKGEYHLVVHIWMKNSQGAYLMTKRSPRKGFPNMWETTGGSAQAGDDSLTAALREVHEETGLVLDPDCGQCIFQLKEADHFADVWLFHQDFDLNDVVLLEGETCDRMYATREDILKLREEGKLVPYSYLDELLDREFAEKALAAMGFSNKSVALSQFRSQEDGERYSAWRVDQHNKSWVLKKAKARELDIYDTYLRDSGEYAPKLYDTALVDGEGWLLMEYVPGNDLTKCDRESLQKTLDSLIAMQERFWSANDNIGAFEDALKSRRNRANYLCDTRLEAAYGAYLEAFQSLPRTLCHDDLLPFNLIVNEKRAVLIDWEVGGILPYPTSLARLIAHAEANEDSLFFMTDADKSYAIGYYYEQFAKCRGVAYETYRYCLNLFLFYEYCEWVYLGNKYGDTDSDRFRRYYRMASDLAISLGYETSDDHLHN